MYELIELMENMSGHPNCQMKPPAGMPEILQEHVLPEDLQLFYRHCGGLRVIDGEYELARIVSPKKVIQSWVGIGLLTPEQLEEGRGHPSWSWYIIGCGDWGSGHNISVDLNPARLGNYYYGFWDSFAEPGSTPVLATSFFDLLDRMWASRGKSFSRDEPEFRSLGDFFELF